MIHLSLFLKNYWEAQEEEFAFVRYEKHFTEEEPCNIYIIGSRPRVIIDNNYIKIIDNRRVELLYKIQKEYNFYEIKGVLELDRDIKGNLKIESDYPYSRFNLIDDNGYFLDKVNYTDNNEVLAKANYALRKSIVNESLDLCNDLKVLYIGKSLKMDKSISPTKRLKNHHKMQHILRKCTTTYTDREIYILLCSFVQRVGIIADGDELLKIGNSFDIMKEVEKRAKKLDATKSLTTQISEAALIDYFDTEFNQDYIGTFGSPKHSYLKNIKESEVETISLEIDLTEIGIGLYSDEVEKKYHHGINYFPKQNFKRETFSIDDKMNLQ